MITSEDLKIVDEAQFWAWLKSEAPTIASCYFTSDASIRFESRGKNVAMYREDVECWRDTWLAASGTKNAEVIRLCARLDEEMLKQLSLNTEIDRLRELLRGTRDPLKQLTRFCPFNSALEDEIDTMLSTISEDIIYPES